jgi:DNA-binding transcriptional LysR family regulator
LVASPRYVEKYGKPKIPKELFSFRCGVWHRNNEQISWKLGEDEILIDASKNKIITINDYTHLRFMVLRDEIITELPPFFCRDLINEGKLVEIMPDYQMPNQMISLLYPSRKHVSSITRAYIDFCVANVNTYLDT